MIRRASSSNDSRTSNRPADPLTPALSISNVFLRSPVAGLAGLLHVGSGANGVARDLCAPVSPILLSLVPHRSAFHKDVRLNIPVTTSILLTTRQLCQVRTNDVRLRCGICLSCLIITRCQPVRANFAVEKGEMGPDRWQSARHLCTVKTLKTLDYKELRPPAATDSPMKDSGQRGQHRGRRHGDE